MHDALYNNQSVLSKKLYREQAVRLGLKLSAFTLSMNAGARAIVVNDLKAGQALGLSETPTFLVCKGDHSVWKLASISQLNSSGLFP